MCIECGILWEIECIEHRQYVKQYLKYDFLKRKGTLQPCFKGRHVSDSCCLTLWSCPDHIHWRQCWPDAILVRNHLIRRTLVQDNLCSSTSGNCPRQSLLFVQQRTNRLCSLSIIDKKVEFFCSWNHQQISFLWLCYKKTNSLRAPPARLSGSSQ